MKGHLGEGAESCGTASVSDEASWSQRRHLGADERLAFEVSGPLGQLMRPGHHRARYSRVALLGQGEYGQVFEEKENSTARTVASKRLPIWEESEGDDSGEGAGDGAASSGSGSGPNFSSGSLSISTARELALAARLQHPNLASVLDVYIDGEYGYIIMERDTLLAEHLRLLGLRDAEDCSLGGAAAAKAVTALAGDLFSGLAYLHSMGVVHRDIKLDNLLVSSAGTLRICDFSLSRVLPVPSPPGNASSAGSAAEKAGSISSSSYHDRRSSDGSCSSCLSGATTNDSNSADSRFGFGFSSSVGSRFSAGFNTFDGSLGRGLMKGSKGERDPCGAVDFTPGLGTIRYGAPEVLSRREYRFAADVWSAGVVLAEMLLGGERLFGGMTELAQLTRIEELLGDGQLEAQPAPGPSYYCSSGARTSSAQKKRVGSRSSSATGRSAKVGRNGSHSSSARPAGSKRKRSDRSGSSSCSKRGCGARKSILRLSIERRSVISEPWPAALLDLVEAALTRDPARRLTAAEALRHPALLLS